MDQDNVNINGQQAQAAVGLESLTTERHSVHNSYIWLGSIRSAFYILLAGFAASASNLSEVFRLFDDLGWQAGKAIVAAVVACIAIIALIFVICLVFRVLSYKRISYLLTPKEFELSSGIINRKHVHVPYQRVQSVDQKASLIQRIAGVCSVSIDTAGGAANKAILVPYLKKSQAEALRTELFRRKYIAMNGGAAAASSVDESYSYVRAGGTNILDPVAGIVNDMEADIYNPETFTGKIRYEYGLSNKELVLAGLSNRSTFAVVLLGLFATLIGFVADFASDAFFENAAGLVHNGHFAVIIVAAVIGGCALLWIVGVISAILTFTGFRARRRETRIEVESGLLSHSVKGVDVDKVQSVIIEQGFIRRLIGYCEIYIGKIDATENGDNGSKGNNSANLGKLIVHPFVKVDRIPEIIDGLMPEYAGDLVALDANFMSVSKRAKRRAIKRDVLWFNTFFWLALAAIPAQLICNFAVPNLIGSSLSATIFEYSALPYINYGCVIAYALFVVTAILQTIKAIRWSKGSGFSLTRDFMLVRNGGWGSTNVIIPRRRIQYAGVRSNPFQRYAKTASLKIRTAAGVGGSFITLVDADEADASGMMEWYKPRQRKQQSIQI